MEDKTARWALATLLSLLGANALVAGMLFALRPDGHRLGMSTSMLRAGPFHDFLVPGLALACLGALALAGAYLVGRAKRGATAVSLVAGVGFLVFLAVQVYAIGPYWLQPIVALLSVGVLTLALVPREGPPMMRAQRRARERAQRK